MQRKNLYTWALRIAGFGNFIGARRIHNAIERDGKYLFPVQAEVVLKRQPYTRLAAYLGVPDEKLGEKTVCVIAPKDNADIKDGKLCAERETEILRLMAGGYSNKEIANSLGVAEGTVKNHVSNILSKLGVRDRTRAVLKAFELGIV